MLNRPKEIDWISDYPKALADALLNEIRSNPQACKNIDEIPTAIGPFGLCASNPIPTYGVASSNYYLNRLRTKEGYEITWKRKGSVNHELIHKPIDHYEVFIYGNIKITELYISPYHWTTSIKAPSGFKFESEIKEEVSKVYYSQFRTTSLFYSSGEYVFTLYSDDTVSLYTADKKLHFYSIESMYEERNDRIMVIQSLESGKIGEFRLKPFGHAELSFSGKIILQLKV